MNLFRGHEQSQCSKTHWVLPGIVMIMQMFHWYKTMRDFWTLSFSVMTAGFMSVTKSIPATARSGAAKIHMSPRNMFVTAQRWMCFAPSAKKGVRPLLLHVDDPYRYRVSQHAPAVPHSTVRQRWPRRTHLLIARRRIPSLPRGSARVPQRSFPRSVDWQSGVPTSPANVVDLWTRITAAVAEVTPEMLRSVWNICSITSGSHTEPQLSQVKLRVFCYIMTVWNTVHVLWINLYKLSKLSSSFWSTLYIQLL
jgi:hypothetical protein